MIHRGTRRERNEQTRRQLRYLSRRLQYPYLRVVCRSSEKSFAEFMHGERDAVCSPIAMLATLLALSVCETIAEFPPQLSYVSLAVRLPGICYGHRYTRTGSVRDAQITLSQ